MRCSQQLLFCTFHEKCNIIFFFKKMIVFKNYVEKCVFTKILLLNKNHRPIRQQESRDIKSLCHGLATLCHGFYRDSGIKCEMLSRQTALCVKKSEVQKINDFIFYLMRNTDLFSTYKTARQTKLMSGMDQRSTNFTSD